MERFKILDSNLCSAVTRGSAKIQYRVGEWTSSPRWLADRGYYPVVFKTLEQAQEFRKNVRYLTGLRIWKCAVRGKAPLQPACNLGLLETEVLKEHPGDWPPGTEMWREIKLISCVKQYKRKFSSRKNTA